MTDCGRRISEICMGILKSRIKTNVINVTSVYRKKDGKQVYNAIRMWKNGKVAGWRNRKIFKK